MTIGPALPPCSPGADRDTPRISEADRHVRARADVLHYLLHIPLIHASGLVVDYLRNGPRTFGPNMFEAPENWGFDLPIVYLAWFLIVTALYYPCRWFAGVKRRSSAPWLSYV
jgi:hypothetical protein